MLLIILFLSCCGVVVKSDTPANCTYADILGKWTFYETELLDQSSYPALSEQARTSIVTKRTIDLQHFFRAVDEYGNQGTWTIIYNQGFEVTVNGRSYFAFSFYKQENKTVTSICDRTFWGWSHDVTVRNWACFRGQKKTPVKAKQHQNDEINILQTQGDGSQHQEEVDKINSVQSNWKAKVNSEFVGMSTDELIKLTGGRRSMVISKPRAAPPTVWSTWKSQFLPETFDWRNVQGINFVPPVRNQGMCGSCFAFSSMGMLESRLRVVTKNEVNITLSPQDVVSCSVYSQGCEGGFPYLIAGRYAKDFGAVEEKCNPYQEQDGTCKTKKSCRRYYVSDYTYVGGYYGACNEELMKEALVNRGPLAVAFEVYSDFMHYSSGIYHHTTDQGLTGYNPFELTNHAVLLVGYGADKATGEKYWTVQNSWGAEWGENGFFRIRRGTDECAIESMAVEATPIP